LETTRPLKEIVPEDGSASAGPADHTDHLSRRNVRGHAVDGGLVSESSRDVSEFEHSANPLDILVLLPSV
jgi:hypothetical protein